MAAFREIARLALPRAVGDPKPLRSRRAAESRRKYWEILRRLCDYFLILNDGVESGQIDKMSALFDLEDFDEANES